MRDDALAWTVPAMRAGYVGRGLTYFAVAGFSLLAISHGGEATGTGSALGRLENSPGGDILLVVIALGLLAYAFWQGLAAALDLEARGSDAKGYASRAGMAISGAIYLGLAFAAISLVLHGGGGGDGQGESRIRHWVGAVMDWPGGRWLVGLVGLGIIGAGVGYVVQGWTMSYERFLAASPASTRWRPALRFGVAAHGVSVGVVGLLFLLAAWRAKPGEAGGLAGAFDWLGDQAYGRVLVVLLCLGLLAFALYCFVNARYRIVPRVLGDKTETLFSAAHRLTAGVV